MDATEVFRNVDLDSDGIPDEPHALTTVKGAATAVGSAVGGAGKAVGTVAANAAGAVAGIFKRDKQANDRGLA